MRFVLYPDAWEKQDDRFHLDGLLLKVADTWHLLDATDHDELIKSPWYEALSTTKQELICNALVQASYKRETRSGPHLRSYDVSRESSSALTPEQARRLAETPLCLVVENRFSDANGFAKHIIEVLAPEHADLVNHPTQPLVFDGGGGITEIPKVIRNHQTRADRLKIPARVVIFMDSDARFPKDSGQGVTQSKSVEKECKMLGVPTHRLKKRSIENYLPDSVLENWAGKSRDRKRWVKAVIALSSDRRDHYPLKSGLRSLFKRDYQLKSIDEVHFYCNLSTEDKKTLWQGERKALPEAFAKRAYWAKVSAKDLRDRAGNEFNNLVTLILDNL